MSGSCAWRWAAESPSPSPAEGLIYGENMRITVCANQGGRKYMEDRVRLHCERTRDGQIDYVYIAVYDGHGGTEASEYARQHLMENIVSLPGFYSSIDEDVLEAIKQGFILTHHHMWQVVDGWARTASGFTSTAGTTASVAFIRRGKLFTGHVGDSAIVLGKTAADGSLVGSRLTIDHKPDSPQEIERIETAGGQVQSKAGVMRVVWSRPVRGHVGPVRRSTPKEHIPFLAVARALGDLWSYNHENENFVVSPEPDTKVVELGVEDVCLLLGSDGLTNVIRPQYATDIVNTHEWRELNEQSGTNAQLLSRPCHSNHSRWLLRHALRGWGCLRADNITVITVIFDPPGSHLPPDAACVMQNCPIDENIEDILTDFPDQMIRVSPEGTQLLRCSPVELLYAGVRDQPVTSLFSWSSQASAAYIGPGMAEHTYEESSGGGVLQMAVSSMYSAKRRMTAAGGTVVSSTKSTKHIVSSSNWRKVSATAENSEEEIEDENEDEDEDEETVMEKEEHEDGDHFNDIGNHHESRHDGRPMRRSASFYCTKHGLCCDRVKRMNTQAEKDPNMAPSLKRQSVGLNGLSLSNKPKYYCRKHGLSCNKVKKMNSDHEIASTTSNCNDNNNNIDGVAWTKNASLKTNKHIKTEGDIFSNGKKPMLKKSDTLKVSPKGRLLSETSAEHKDLGHIKDVDEPHTKRRRGRPSKKAQVSLNTPVLLLSVRPKRSVRGNICKTEPPLTRSASKNIASNGTPKTRSSLGRKICEPMTVPASVGSKRGRGRARVMPLNTSLQHLSPQTSKYQFRSRNALSLRVK